MNIKELDSRYIANTYTRFPVLLDHGAGSIVYDEAGKKYIDMGSGIAVNSFGIADEQWQSAITAQLGKLQHTSNLYYSEPCVQLAELLCERTGMKKVFFANSGAEANEGAIKAARRRAFLKYGEGRSTIITLKNSFHGRTVTTLSATGQDSFHTDFMPFTEGFIYASAEDVSEVAGLADKNGCCAVMMEMIQGEGGIYELTQEFVDGVLAVAEKHDLLIIVDEVQTGNGRTGAFYSYMNYGFTPDIVTTAKGLAGGLPLGAVLFGEKTADIYTPGTHGSTFGGNPVCCAAAMSILSRIDDELLASVAEKGEYIRSELTGAAGVAGVSGRGLMIGIEPVRPVRDVIDDCMENGVLVLSAKNKVRLLPALNIPFEELKAAVAVIKEVLAK